MSCANKDSAVGINIRTTPFSAARTCNRSPPDHVGRVSIPDVSKVSQMTNDPKMAPSAPKDDSARPIAQHAPQEKAQEKAAPSFTPVNGAPEPKKTV